MPNSTYITELDHLREPDDAIPEWHDIVAVLTLTMCGLLLGCVSLAYVHLLLNLSVVGTAWTWVIVIGYLVFANFGIYIGRQLRFNSWDAFVRPVDLLTRTSRHLFVEGHVAMALTYTLVFSAFTTCVYLVIALSLVP